MPGLNVRESLRLAPTLANETSSLDLRKNTLQVLLARTIADHPPVPATMSPTRRRGAPSTWSTRSRGSSATSRCPRPGFALSGWAGLAPSAHDSEIDALTGVPRGWRFTSSSRFEGLAINRASSAFDGTIRPWIGNWLPGHANPWLAWEAPRRIRVKQMRLTPGPAGFGFPQFVRIETPTFSKVLPVGQRTGIVRLGRTVSTRSMRITMLATQVGSGPEAQGRLLQAVAIREVTIPGLRAPAPRRDGVFTTACGAVHVSDGPSTVLGLVSGSVRALDNGQPLVVSGCGPSPALQMPAGESHVSSPAGPVMRMDHVALVSRPPVPQTPTVAQVVSPGHGGARRATRSS